MSTGTRLLGIPRPISSGLFQSPAGDTSPRLSGASATPTCAPWGDEPAQLGTTFASCIIHMGKKPVLGCLHGQQQECDSGHPLPLPSSFQKRNVLRARQRHWISQHGAANSAPRVFPAGSPTLPPHHPTGRNNNPCPCTPSGGRQKDGAIMPLIYEV